VPASGRRLRSSEGSPGAQRAKTSSPAPADQALQRTILAATLVAAVLRCFRLGHQSLWIDEQFTRIAAGVPGPLVWHDLLENVHGPLHALAVAGAAALGGSSEWVLRAPSAVAGVAMVPAMAWLARRWLGRDTVPAAVWLTAGSPFLVWYSQECRNYAFVMLAAVLATASLLALHDRVTPLRTGRYVLCVLAGVLSNLSFALLVPFHAALWFAPGVTRAARLRALRVVGIVAVIAVLPWLAAIGRIWDWSRLSPGREMHAGESALRGQTTYHLAAVPFAVHTAFMGFSGGPSMRELRRSPMDAVRAHLPELALSTLVFGALGVFGVMGLRRRRRLRDLALWAVAPALVVSYFATQNFKVFSPRYLAVSVPCLLLTLAAAFADLGPRARRGFAGAVGLLWALALARAAFDPAYGREDYRNALAHVKAEFRPGERVIAVGAPEPVEWYGRGMPVVRWWLGFADDPDRMARTLTDTLMVTPGAWVVGSRMEDQDPEDRCAHWLDQRVQPSQRWAARGVRVWHWRRPRPAPPSAPRVYGPPAPVRSEVPHHVPPRHAVPRHAAPATPK
jgi:4-amino-4-deoxy-L-arabinose transferase-like glycosyltransferase